MKNNYKRSYIVIDCILVFFLIFLLLNIKILKCTNFWFFVISSIITFLIIMFRYGYESKNRRFTYETMFYIFSYTVVYLIVVYILGIFTGFSSTIYKLNFSNIIKNIIPYLLIIATGELLRDEVVRKCEKSFISYALITIIFILIDCTIYLTTFDLSIGDGQIKFICYILLPSISKNCLLLYTTRIAGPYPNLIYRILTELKNYVVPIEPNFGMYLESILITIIPAIIGFALYISLKQYQNKEVEGKTLKQSKIYKYAATLIICVVVTSLVILTSCKFKYGMLSIGSGSMTGVINKGDAVIYKALDKNKLPSKGEVIVFKKEGKIIVHRIIKKVDVSKTETVYYTKGDANSTEDGYPIPVKDIVGTVQKRIRYIGLPSVALHELTKHESTL